MTNEDGDDPRTRLIKRGLGSQHLWGFLPGRDNRSAVAAAVAGMGSWCGPDHIWGEVNRQGVGEWDGLDAYRTRRRSNAIRFVTWPEALAVIARGCTDGHRERYEAVYTAWCAEIGPTDWSVPRCGYPGAEACRLLHEATAALIRHGCQRTITQEALF